MNVYAKDAAQSRQLFVSLDEAMRLYVRCKSRQTIYNLLKRHEFPPPVQLSPGRIAFRVADLDDWLIGRAAGTRKIPSRGRRRSEASLELI